MRLCEAVFRTVLMGQSKAILVKYAHMYKNAHNFYSRPRRYYAYTQRKSYKLYFLGIILIPKKQTRLPFGIGHCAHFSFNLMIQHMHTFVKWFFGYFGSFHKNLTVILIYDFIGEMIS